MDGLLTCCGVTGQPRRACPDVLTRQGCVVGDAGMRGDGGGGATLCDRAVMVMVMAMVTAMRACSYV